MNIALTMPQFGESITQGHIVQWLKKEGDSISEGEPLIEMETEKSVFSYESPFKGKLTKIVEAADRQVNVGAVIAQFEVSDEDGKKYLSLGVGKPLEGAVAPAPSKPAPVSASTPTLAAPTAPSIKQEAKPQSAPVKSGPVSPLIRSLAKENNISLDELAKVHGTGPEGRLTKSDFLEYLKTRSVGREPVSSTVPATPSAALVSAASAPIKKGVTRVTVSPIRARIAENMVLSKQTIPHAGCSVDVDLSLIEKWRSSQEKAPGYLAFSLMATLNALKHFPLINSSYKDGPGGRWIEQYDHVNLGIAVATDQGLIVPVIRNAQDLSFNQLQKEVVRLVEGGRKGTLKIDELTGATITVNNTGAIGAVRTSQVIPPPQAAILAFNRVVKRPWAVVDRVEIRPIMALDIAFDHRILDGDIAGRFLTEVSKNLENFDFSHIN